MDGVTKYSLRRFGIFSRPLVTLDGDKFCVRAKWYSSADIQRMFIWSPPIAGIFGSFSKRATVYLSDGVAFTMYGNEVVKENSGRAFRFFTWRTDAFDELVAHFQRLAGYRRIDPNSIA